MDVLKYLRLHNEYDYIEYTVHNVILSFFLINIFLFKGISSFANKSVKTQEAGGKGLMIIQTADVWPYTMTDSKNEAKQLTIPVAMISKADGQVCGSDSICLYQKVQKCFFFLFFKCVGICRFICRYALSFLVPFLSFYSEIDVAPFVRLPGI